MKKLEGKVAYVTGAGRGIGRAVALKLADDGARIVVNDLDQEPADEVVAEIKAGGGEAIAIAANIGRKPELAALVEKTRDAWGRIDILGIL